MTSEVAVMNPDIETILRDVARTQGSSLLGVPREQVTREMLSCGSTVSARAAGFSTAERQLLLVHREELAFVLRRAAYHAVLSTPSGHDRIVDPAVADLRDAIPDERRLRVDASRALREPDSGFGAGEDRELLERCVAPNADSWPDAGQLAAASQRLVPTDSARIYFAMQAVLLGSETAALLALRPILRGPSTDEIARAAWVDASWAHASLGHDVSALKCAQQAAKVDPSDIRAQGNRIWIAARLGAENEIADAAMELARDSRLAHHEFAALVAWFDSARASRRAEVADLDRTLERGLRAAPPQVRRLFRAAT